VIAKGCKSATLYVVDGHKEVGATLGVGYSGIKISHKRLLHMSKKGIEILHKKNQCLGLKAVDMDLSKHCIYGNQKRT